MTHGYLPLADGALLAWSANFLERITATPKAYGLEDKNANAYRIKHEAYAAALARAQESMTRTPPAIQAKELAKAELIVLARQLVRMVQATPTITNEQRSELQITLRKSGRTPVPPPSVSPDLDVVSVSQRTVTIRIHNSAGASERGKPAGAVQALVYYVAGEDYPSDPQLWSFAGMATRSKFTFTVPDTVAAGTRLWIRAAWTNRAGVSGPISAPISTNIQGGGTAVAAPEMRLAA